VRLFVFAAMLALAACGQPESPPPLPVPAQNVVAPPWFICDATDAPVLLVFERNGSKARVTQYDKPNGALIQRTEYQIGAEEGAAGSIYTALLQNGAEAGAIRRINPEVLETPGAAYTPVYSSVRLGEQDISCRWVPRTRLMGFTGRRTIVVSEDGDGDLIYHSYDFAATAQAQQIEIAENGRTTTFSLEARDGVENMDADGSRFQFQTDVETEIIVVSGRDGRGRVDVRRHGPEPLQSEDLIAYVLGQGAE
jgi:hypothetical protein